jgi:hypothetical protein
MTTWSKIKWGLRIIVLIFVGLFLHYELPQRDIVQITNTYNRLTAVGANALFYGSPDVGTGEGDQRDIRFIEARFENGRVIIYRNEDTGWVWPPYFKYDSSNLQAEAGNLKSTEASPKWAVVTHYGWRLPWMSIYPNAVAVRAASGPDESLFPWLNLIILGALAAIWYLLWRMWAQFRERTLDPIFAGAGEALDKADATADAARDKVGGVWTRLMRWIGTWRSKR